MEDHIRQTESILQAVLAWAGKQKGIRAVALVGSRARGAARLDSDIDLVLLSSDAQSFRRDPHWVDAIDWTSAGARPSTWRDDEYGRLWSRHVSLAGGPEVEFGFADV